jgi:hypothetical protein
VKRYDGIGGIFRCPSFNTEQYNIIIIILFRLDENQAEKSDDLVQMLEDDDSTNGRLMDTFFNDYGAV